MPLHPRIRELLDKQAALGITPLAKMTPGQARQQELRTMAEIKSQPEQVGKVEDRLISVAARELPIRIYAPEASGDRRSLFPALIYFHAGGWVLGNLDSEDRLCREIANRAGCVLISVDYPRAPEHKFPVAVEACYAAIGWVAQPHNASAIGIDPDRMAVGGRSSGGNLAAVMSLLSRERRGPKLVFQVLCYPVTNYASNTPSFREFAKGYWMERETIDWIWKHYLRTEDDGRSPYASPLRAEDLSGLPPALVITAEFDMLRDEGEAFASRLRDAGVPVACRRYEGVIHGFLGMRAVVDQGRQAVDEIVNSLKTAFATGSTNRTVSGQGMDSE